MSMDRLLKISRVLLPLLVAGVAGAVRVVSAPVDISLGLILLGGTLLGAAMALMLESVAALAGHRPADQEATEAIAVRLERDKDRVLRAIKDIEFDAAMQRLDPKEVKQLNAPLRRRALGLLRQIDEASGRPLLTIEDKIQQAVEHRRSRGAG